MDVLSDIMRTVRIGGALYFRTEYSSPWGIHLPPEGDAARFHYVKEGECWVRMPDGETVHVRAGELAVVAHGAEHTVLNPPESPVLPLDAVIEEAGFEGEGTLEYGGGGDISRLVCGYFTFDDDGLVPLVGELPPIVHLTGSDPRTNTNTWIDEVVGVIDREAGARHPGADAVIGRLCEILFIQSLRAHVTEAPSTEGVLAGLADPAVGQALTAIHAHSEQPWTVEKLAREAGMSRTTFAERFRELMGCGPMQYVTRWRIQAAMASLLDPRASVAEVGAAVGYRSEAAFSRAFKRLVGVGPGEYRQRSAE